MVEGGCCCQRVLTMSKAKEFYKTTPIVLAEKLKKEGCAGYGSGDNA